MPDLIEFNINVGYSVWDHGGDFFLIFGGHRDIKNLNEITNKFTYLESLSCCRRVQSDQGLLGVGNLIVLKKIVGNVAFAHYARILYFPQCLRIATELGIEGYFSLPMETVLVQYGIYQTSFLKLIKASIGAF